MAVAVNECRARVICAPSGLRRLPAPFASILKTISRISAAGSRLTARPWRSRAPRLLLQLRPSAARPGHRVTAAPGAAPRRARPAPRARPTGRRVRPATRKQVRSDRVTRSKRCSAPRAGAAFREPERRGRSMPGQGAQQRDQFGIESRARRGSAARSHRPPTRPTAWSAPRTGRLRGPRRPVPAPDRQAEVRQSAIRGSATGSSATAATAGARSSSSVQSSGGSSSSFSSALAALAVHVVGGCRRSPPGGRHRPQTGERTA